MFGSPMLTLGPFLYQCHKDTNTHHLVPFSFQIKITFITIWYYNSRIHILAIVSHRSVCIEAVPGYSIASFYPLSIYPKKKKSSPFLG